MHSSRPFHDSAESLPCSPRLDGSNYGVRSLASSFGDDDDDIASDLSTSGSEGTIHLQYQGQDDGEEGREESRPSSPSPALAATSISPSAASPPLPPLVISAAPHIGIEDDPWSATTRSPIAGQLGSSEVANPGEALSHTTRPPPSAAPPAPPLHPSSPFSSSISLHHLDSNSSPKSSPTRYAAATSAAASVTPSPSALRPASRTPSHAFLARLHSSSSSTAHPPLSPPFAPSKAASESGFSSSTTAPDLSSSVSSLGSLENYLDDQGSTSADSFHRDSASSAPGSDVGDGVLPARQQQTTRETAPRRPPIPPTTSSSANLVWPTIRSLGSLPSIPVAPPTAPLSSDSSSSDYDDDNDELDQESIADRRLSHAGSVTSLLRVVVLGAARVHRTAVVDRLISELSVDQLEEDTRPGWEDGKSGIVRLEGGKTLRMRKKATSTATSRRVWIGESGSDTASVYRLIDRIRDLHGPLARQLAPPRGVRGSATPATQPLLRPKDVRRLAAAGLGRGPLGWIECVIVLIEPDHPASSLAAARALAPMVPVLLVIPPSSTSSTAASSSLLSPLSDLPLVDPLLLRQHQQQPCNDAVPFLDISHSSAAATFNRSSTVEPIPTPRSSRSDDPFSDLATPEDLPIFASLFATSRGIRTLRKRCARSFMRLSWAAEVADAASSSLSSSSFAVAAGAGNHIVGASGGEDGEGGEGLGEWPWSSHASPSSSFISSSSLGGGGGVKKRDATATANDDDRPTSNIRRRRRLASSHKQHLPSSFDPLHLPRALGAAWSALWFPSSLSSSTLGGGPLRALVLSGVVLLGVVGLALLGGAPGVSRVMGCTGSNSRAGAEGVLAADAAAVVDKVSVTAGQAGGWRGVLAGLTGARWPSWVVVGL